MQDLKTLIYVISIVIGLLIIWLIFNEIRFNKLRKKLELFIPEKSKGSVTDILWEYVKKSEKLGEKVNTLEKKQIETERKMLEALKFVEIVHYNAFSDIGGETSFSLSLLNGNGDGVVVSSLKSRTDARVYVKPILNGKSRIKLSNEEEMAIKKALQKSK
ncbi:MAG: DUF4446 family protein [Candidatus Humimicrobiia bacterium]